MANFNNDVGINPSYPLKEQSSIAVSRVKFGSGYEMAVQFGINQDLKKYSLTFTNISTTDRNTIVNFLEARKGTEAFDWTPPNQSSSSKYRCSDWDDTLVAANIYVLNADFVEVAIP